MNVGTNILLHMHESTISITRLWYNYNKDCAYFTTYNIMILLFDCLFRALVVLLFSLYLFRNQDFGEDASLTQMLVSFLRGLLATSCSDSKEALLGQKLME